MKIFVLSFVLLAAVGGLNGHCVRHQPNGPCEQRIFSEPEPKEIHYIYHGESCNCPKYHDTIIEKPVIVHKKPENLNYEYDIIVPVQPTEDVTRYLFDVRVEKPIPKAPERPCGPVNYAIEVPRIVPENVQRYIYDSRIEQPVKPCQEKPWQGLVAQVDRVLMPAPPRQCQNMDHSPETCNCGCREPSHTPSTCTCGNSDHQIPISFNSRPYSTN